MRFVSEIKEVGVETGLVSKALATQTSGPESDLQHWWLSTGCGGPISSVLAARQADSWNSWPAASLARPVGFICIESPCLSKQ